MARTADTYKCRILKTHNKSSTRLFRDILYLKTNNLREIDPYLWNGIRVRDFKLEPSLKVAYLRLSVQRIRHLDPTQRNVTTLKMPVTEFQERVYTLLTQIPEGRVTTYGALPAPSVSFSVGPAIFALLMKVVP